MSDHFEQGDFVIVTNRFASNAVYKEGCIGIIQSFTKTDDIFSDITHCGKYDYCVKLILGEYDRITFSSSLVYIYHNELDLLKRSN